MRSELEFLESLKKKIPRFLQGPWAIGDDAALAPKTRPGHAVVVTTDVVVDGVDFHLKAMRPERAGRKALAVNLSDLAAMGASPLGFVAALGIPLRFRDRWVERFYDGILSLAKKYRVPCLGGDLSRSGLFFASIAMWGEAKPDQIVRRNGARAGDLIAVTGNLGGSILGRHADFEPRIEQGRFLATRFRVTAMLDISDGLLQDLGHILRESGVGARLDLEKIPIARAAIKLERGHADGALRRALSDGEDFELLLTVRPKDRSRLQTAWKRRFPDCPLTWIGEILPGRGRGIDFFHQGKRDRTFKMRSTGFSHFGRAS